MDNDCESMHKGIRHGSTNTRGGSRLVSGGSQSVVVICHSIYEPGGGGRHMCRSTYIRVIISRLLILQSLH